MAMMMMMNSQEIDFKCNHEDTNPKKIKIFGYHNNERTSKPIKPHVGTFYDVFLDQIYHAVDFF